MKSDNQYSIDVKHLVKHYRKSVSNAVDDVSFYVERGAFFSLLGPNGAGKTTIISILTTILSYSSGTVAVAGFDVEKQSDKVRQRIGVIFQNPSLDSNLTAEENIRFHANLYGLYPYMPSFSLMNPTYQNDVNRLASILGMEKDIFKPVKALSGGMKRKLEIIRSLMHNPHILFLDEPTTGLDPISRANLWQYLKDIRTKEKTTIFLTTHYLEEAEDSDYLCIINNGKIVGSGTPADIKKALIENFISIDAKDRGKLTRELAEKRIKFTGDGPYRLQLKYTPAHQLVKGIDTPLTLMQVHTPTLEQAYVRIIEGDASV